MEIGKILRSLISLLKNFSKIFLISLIYFVDRKIKSWISQIYEKDSIVEYKDYYYIALEERNYVEPDDLFANFIYVKYFFNFRLCSLTPKRFSGSSYSFKGGLPSFN